MLILEWIPGGSDQEDHGALRVSRLIRRRDGVAEDRLKGIDLARNGDRVIGVGDADRSLGGGFNTSRDRVDMGDGQVHAVAAIR